MSQYKVVHCNINGKDVDISNSEGYTLFQNFYDSFSMMAIEGIDIDAKPDDSESVIKATYHNSDGTDSTISISEDGGKYYIFKDGEYTGGYAPAVVLRNSFLDNFLSSSLQAEPRSVTPQASKDLKR